MNQQPPGPPKDELAVRLARLVGAPDRADWDDVRGRAARSHGRLDRLTRAARPIRLAALGMAVAALAAVLVALFVLAPEDRTTTPTARSFTTVKPLASDDIPAEIRARLDVYGVTADARPVVHLFDAPTFNGPVSVWRGGLPTGEYRTYTMDYQRRVDDLSACPLTEGAVVPADPPGAPNRVVMPDVSGLTSAQAKARIEAAGLTAKAPPPSVTVALPRAGTTLFAGGTVYLPSGQESVVNAPTTVDDIAVCGAGGNPTGRWTIGAAAPSVGGVATQWSNGNLIEGTVAGGMFVLPLPSNDTCAHPESLRSIVVRDRRGQPVAGLSDGDGRFQQVVDAWGPRIFHSCVATIGHPALKVSLFDEPPDPLPGALAGSPESFPAPIDRRTAHVVASPAPAGRYGDLSLVIVDTADRAQTCLVIVGSRGVTGGANCVPRDSVGVAWLLGTMQHSRQGDPIVLAGVVSDGIAAVSGGGRESRVVHNVFVLVFPAGTPRPDRLTGTNAAGRRAVGQDVRSRWP